MLDPLLALQNRNHEHTPDMLIFKPSLAERDSHISFSFLGKTWGAIRNAKEAT